MRDVIVVGGSYAGISAALQVARARRRVVVVDTGQRRNRFAAAAHGFLGQDGRDPAAIAAAARLELLAYPTVTWLGGEAVAARAEGDGFAVMLASGEVLHGKRVVLATGVVDDLPDLPGLAERWGRHVFHCPYCHGYELDGGAIGVLATGAHSFHQAMMLPDWGPTSYFTRGVHEPDADELRELERRGVTIERTPVAAIEGVAEIRLVDGRRLAFAGLFAAPAIRIASSLAAQLGCELEDGPLGAFLKTDPMRETTVPGVFAAGDMATAAGSIAFAVAEGARAGVAAHRSLIFR